jgi:hypothetical protein
MPVTTKAKAPQGPVRRSTKRMMALGNMRVMVLESDVSEFRQLGYRDAGPYFEGKGASAELEG